MNTPVTMHPNRFLAILLLIAAVLLLPAAGDPPPTPAAPETAADLAAALAHRLDSAPGAKTLSFELFTPELDTAFTSPDGQTAVLWLALRDDAGRVLATEPGLALANRTDSGWQVLLPGDPGWEETFNALPEGMLPLEQSPAPKSMAYNPTAITGPLTGYYLPYAAGTARWLEGSISHFQSVPELGYPSCGIDTCRYAYDFTDKNHFPLLASKDGTVVAARDSCADGSPTCTNYIVLRDTNGQTFQIYLHLAHGTIPDKLTPGTAVKRGQYIGDSDDTGYSTSQHVHFMVTNDLWSASGYYWGHSVDIRFADVPINNGIPRNCYEVTRFPIYDGATECLGDKSDPRNPANDWYVSGNVGAYPPTGALTRPAAGAVVNSGANTMIDVTANASDDVRVTAVRLVAKVNGKWVEIGPKVTKPASGNVYDWDVDLCAAGAFNGPLEVALRVWDHEGNVSSALSPRTIQVDHACPPPVSQLGPAETVQSTAVRLNWSAGDAGAGISSFELQWRTEGGEWNSANKLVIPGSQRSTWFLGQPGQSYAFRLRALDVNGQTEAWPAGSAPETSTGKLPTTCTPDGFEPDDTPAQASPLAVGEWGQRNLCGAGNPDWFRVTLPGDTEYAVTAFSQSGGAAVRLTVYADDATTVVAGGEASGLGQNATVTFTPPAAGDYWILAEPLEGGLMGTQAVYRLGVYEPKYSFLPLVMR